MYLSNDQKFGIACLFGAVVFSLIIVVSWPSFSESPMQEKARIFNECVQLETFNRLECFLLTLNDEGW